MNVTNFNELTQRVKNVINTLLTTSVTLTDTQTLTNKTLTSPIVNGGTITGATVSGGVSSALAPVQALSADGAITIAEGVTKITKTSAGAYTIAAPSTEQSGTIMTIVSMTDFAHVITFTGSTFIKGAATAYNTLTFDAYKGAAVRIIAVDGYWTQNAINNITPSNV